MSKQFDLFLGYSRTSKVAALELAQGLEKRGLHVWKVSKQPYHTKLRQVLTKRFNIGELKTLCFDVNVDYDVLPGEGKEDKARELIAYLDRHDRISELLRIGEDSRHDIEWGDLLGQSGEALYDSRILLREETQEAILSATRNVLILVGRDGTEPWELSEMQDCLMKISVWSLPIFCVLLPGAPSSPSPSSFLGKLVMVDLRNGISDGHLIPLVWSITGISNALESNHELVSAITESRIKKQPTDVPILDPWGIASIKSRLHALSEIVAREAIQEATLAASIYDRDMLTILAPLMLDLRWGRGYASSLETLFDTSAIESGDALKDALSKNRKALIPLIARFGLPGSEWLLPNDEEYPEVGKKLFEMLLPGQIDSDQLK